MRTPQTCLFCSGPVTGRRGEHVLPTWLLRRYDRDGPLTLEINGEPEKDRDGAVRMLPNADRAMLRAVCGSADPKNCNGWLENTFELTGKRYVRKLLGASPMVDATGAEQFAKWAMKTLLLLAHPQTTREGFRTQPSLAWPRFPDNWLPELREHNRFPDDMSLWLAVHDTAAGNGQLVDAGHIELNHTVYNDGSGGGHGNTNNIGFATQDYRRVVELQLAYHPLSVVTHPFEQAGLATRLWPDPPSGLDLNEHALLGDVGLDQWKNAFSVGGSSIGVRPGHALNLDSPNWPPPEVCLHP